MGLANVEWGAVISVIVVIVIFVIVDRGIHRYKKGQLLRSILQDKEGYYSLTKFQFLSWTVVFLFSLLWVYLVRMQGGVLTPIQALPTNTLVLMGINTGSALSSSAIRGWPGKEEGRKDFWGILYSEDHHRPDLTRVQFFVWTVASIVIYVFILLGLMFGPYLFNFPPVSLQTLSIPDVDPSLVTLMGLSHTAYVGAKYVQRRKKE